MDFMQQMVFTRHSTMSSATGVATFLLEITRLLSGATSGLARQTLIAAVHRFSRTFLVPALLLHCARCYLTPQRPYRAIIPDGEVLSVQRNQSEPFYKEEQDVPVVAMDVGLGACLPSPGMRSAVRKRACHAHGDEMRLSAADRSSLVLLRGALTTVPHQHPVGPVLTHFANVSWACAFVLFSFYCIEDKWAQPGVVPAGGLVNAALDDGVAAAVPLVGVAAKGQDAGKAGEDGVGAGMPGGAAPAAPAPAPQPGKRALLVSRAR